MNRKGLKHLPKAGTRPAKQALSHDHRSRASHPFASDTSRRYGTGWAIGTAIVAIIVVIGIIGLIVLN